MLSPFLLKLKAMYTDRLTPPDNEPEKYERDFRTGKIMLDEDGDPMLIGPEPEDRNQEEEE